MIARLAVFCASSVGNDPRYVELARSVGKELARRGIGIVYGGGGSGLMGALSGAAVDAGGEVIGVIPHKLLDREHGREDISELVVVDDMHERKAGMAARADAFLCLPGGLGTLEELTEVWSWRTLGFLDQPVGLLDTAFWKPLLDALREMVDVGFLARSALDDLVVEDTLDRALQALEERG